jgi:hypothetical protein
MKTQLKKIRELDQKAADYLENVVIPRYGGFDYLKPGKDLLDHFIWSLTPQGRNYWFDVWCELNGIKNDTFSKQEFKTVSSHG